MIYTDANEYADDVISGKQVAGKRIIQACQRFKTDIDKGDYIFDKSKDSEAQRIINFIEQLCHHWKGKWKGQLIKLEPHQKFYFANVYGFYRRDGRRRFNTTVKFVARKAAKTTEKALESLWHLTKSGEHGAQIWAGATKEEQARIVVNDTGQIANMSPELNKRLKLFKARTHYSRVYYEETLSFMAAIGGDSKTNDGLDPSMIIIDEYHAHKNTAILDILESAQGARENPMRHIISTAGYNTNHPCYFQTRATANKILDGILQDESQFIMMFEPDEVDDWQDENAWEKSNPSLGITPNWAYMRNRLIKAINEGGSAEVDFKTKNLNIWTSVYSTWIPNSKVIASQKKLDIRDFYGSKLFVGWDFASKRDTTSATFLIEKDDRVYWFSFCWIPRERADYYEKEYSIPFKKWEKEGHIFIVEGNAIHHTVEVVPFLIDHLRNFDLESMRFDTAFASAEVIMTLNDSLDVEYEAQKQGFALHRGIDEIESTINNITIDDNPVINWQLSNVQLEKSTTNDAVRIVKGKRQGLSARENEANKVDIPVSAAMAFMGMVDREVADDIGIETW